MKAHIGDVKYCEVNWINMDQERKQWRVFVKPVGSEKFWSSGTSANLSRWTNLYR
jgi:hypothetical protein